jgi:hypothetical protein
MAPTPLSLQAAAATEEEDDYLTMPLPSPSSTTTTSKHRYKPETLTEKKKRLARERELKAHPKSKAELAVEAKRKREEGLARNILLGGIGAEGQGEGDGGKMNNKGAAMMAKLGYVPGMPLGKPVEVGQGDKKDDEPEGTKDTRLLEPIGISEREGRGGIGADAERKRKIREEFERVESGEKRVKVEVEGYRERQAREREEARREGLLRGAMGVAERLEEEEEGDELEGGRDVSGETVRVKKGRKRRRLQDINVLWRGLVKQREVAERDRRMRYDLHQSLSTRADYNDPEEHREDRLALGKTETEEVDAEELDGEDEELKEFESLDVAERLDRLVVYLRERWRYCFWCKHRYEDEAMEGCPGVREEDHD